MSLSDNPDFGPMEPCNLLKLQGRQLSKLRSRTGSSVRRAPRGVELVRHGHYTSPPSGPFEHPVLIIILNMPGASVIGTAVSSSGKTRKGPSYEPAKPPGSLFDKGTCEGAPAKTLFRAVRCSHTVKHAHWAPPRRYLFRTLGLEQPLRVRVPVLQTHVTGPKKTMIP